jgi:hypothetical protein
LNAQQALFQSALAFLAAVVHMELELCDQQVFLEYYMCTLESTQAQQKQLCNCCLRSAIVVFASVIGDHDHVLFKPTSGSIN